ncbi:hypothetical protein SDC9_116990 [bioreactor metagenome]|uniref:Uncharacterized protein n=1 Tax=bioreactor metagenome TaxID=1076179 RepID=A0A645BXC0_9ZZZZ
MPVDACVHHRRNGGAVAHAMVGNKPEHTGTIVNHDAIIDGIGRIGPRVLRRFE